MTTFYNQRHEVKSREKFCRLHHLNQLLLLGEERWNSFDNRWETEGGGGEGETETNELDHSHEVCEGYESESSLDSTYEDSLHMAALIGKSLLDRSV